MNENKEILKYFKWGDKKKIAQKFDISISYLTKIISGSRNNSKILKAVYSEAEFRKKQYESKIIDLKKKYINE